MCVQPSELVPLDSPSLECTFSLFSLWDSRTSFEIQLFYPDLTPLGAWRDELGTREMVIW